MTPSQTKAVNFFQEWSKNNGETFNCPDGSILIKNDRGIYSIGIRGGITKHFDIINGKLFPNGCYAKK